MVVAAHDRHVLRKARVVPEILRDQGAALGGGVTPQQPVQQQASQPVRQAQPARQQSQQPQGGQPQRRQPEAPKGRPDPLSSKIQRIDRTEE